jgi:signal transduction histidine kinase/ActR/RegA family two-component response regulator
MLDALRAASGLRRLGVSGPVWERGLSEDILLLISAPLVRADGTRSGTVVGALRVAPLVNVVSRMSDPADVQWVLANAAGQVLHASPDTGLTPMGNLPESHLGRILLNRPEEPLLHDGTVAGSSRRLRAYVARDDDYRLLVIAQRPALAAAGSSVGIYAMMAGIMAGVILTAALVARLAVARLSQPLEQFAEAAGKQARAGLAERMPVPTDRVAGEIREIYATFNRLADRLNETYAALLRNNQSLEQRVSERTGELERVRREAVEASDSKTAFLALAGREFRTPLEAIMAEAEWLRGQIREPGLALQLDLIRDGGRMLLAVVEDLQELSRLEAGRLEIRPGPLELRALCERVVADASGEALARGLGLTLESTLVRDLWVETDGARLERALRVLLRDAIHATDAGNVWLCVDAAGSDLVELRFRVVDSGPGVSDSQRAALLRPAFPADPGTPVDRSAGLGLTLGRRLIELLGGRIDIHGGEVRGLELDFVLKVKAVPAPLPVTPPPALEMAESFEEIKPPLLIRHGFSAPAPARLPAVEAVTGVALANCELLVVDDTPANLEVMRALLEDRCRRLVTVASAREALALLKSERFTAALIDLEMPEMDGFALLDEIRQWQQGEASRGCRLIAVSAHPAEDMRTDCWARGFDEYVEKPVSRKSLVAALSGFGRSGS